MITLRDIYQALSALDCAVTRGWPQAMIPLPAIAFSGCEDSVGEDGSRRFQVELKARAASPEGADALAAGADGILTSLGLRRTLMKDGAEKDSDTFLKTLRYEMREGPGTGETLEVTAGGQAFMAIPILRRAKVDRSACPNLRKIPHTPQQPLSVVSPLLSSITGSSISSFGCWFCSLS